MLYIRIWSKIDFLQNHQYFYQVEIVHDKHQWRTTMTTIADWLPLFFKTVIMSLAVWVIMSGNSAVSGETGKRMIFEMSGDTSTNISVKVFQEFSLKIKSNPSTGFGWSLDHPLDETMVQQIGHDTEDSGKIGLVGAPQFEIWTFKALKAGETSISIKYARSWEKNIPPVKMHTFIVTVE